MSDTELEARRANKEAVEALEICRGLSYASKDDRERAADILREVKKQAKRMADREQEITRPLRTALESARDLFRPIRNAYAEMEAMIKSGLADSMATLAAQVEEQVASAVGDSTQLAKLAETEIAPPTGVQIRRIACVRVVDIGIIPRKFLRVDEAAVLEAIRAKEIVPGAEIYYKTSVAVK